MTVMMINRNIIIRMTVIMTTIKIIVITVITSPLIIIIIMIKVMINIEFYSLKFCKTSFL